MQGRQLIKGQGDSVFNRAIANSDRAPAAGVPTFEQAKLEIDKMMNMTMEVGSDGYTDAKSSRKERGTRGCQDV